MSLSPARVIVLQMVVVSSQFLLFPKIWTFTFRRQKEEGEEES